MSPDNQAINQSTFVGYFSIRLTLETCWWSKIYSYLVKDRSYVAFPHVGNKTEKQHWHVFIIAPSTDDQVFRNAINRKLGLKGNSSYAMKYMKNPIVEAITYGKHDPLSVPRFSEDMASAVESAPPWVERQTVLEEHLVSADRKKVRDWQLTFSNLVCQAVHHARANGLTQHTLKNVIHDLMTKTKWRPSPQLLRSGVDSFYEEDFKFRMDQQKKLPMDWWQPKSF